MLKSSIHNKNQSWNLKKKRCAAVNDRITEMSPLHYFVHRYISVYGEISMRHMVMTNNDFTSFTEFVNSNARKTMNLVQLFVMVFLKIPRNSIKQFKCLQFTIAIE